MTSKIRFRGATSGFVELAAPDAAGSNTLILPSGTGASGDFLRTDGSGSLSFAAPANLGTAATASGTDLQFNSGFGSVATAYGCRAWINFDGTTSFVRDNGNASSITDNGTGNYTVNFTSSLPDDDYAAISDFGNQTSGGTCTGSLATNGFVILTFDGNFSLTDRTQVFAAVFR